MSNFNDILDRFQTYIYIRSIIPTEWFEDFDKLNTGRVTKDRFRRCFDFVRYPFRSGEFDVLADHYREGDMVNYRRFCDDALEIYTNKDLEKRPLDTVKDSHEIVSRTQGRVASNTDPELEALFSKLCHQIKTRGVHVRESYMDFDRHNNGNITQSQFLRAMPFKDLTAGEMQLILKRYADPILRDVNYRRLHTDLNDYMQNIHPPIVNRSTGLLPHQAASIKLKKFDKDPDQIIEEFAQYVYEKRVRIIEFFQQHDPHNCGMIPLNKFEAVLPLFGFYFSKNDIDYLCNEYKTSVDYTNYARYKDFCNDVDSLANANYAMTKSRELRPNDTRLEGILDRIRSTIVRYRINCLPTIQDFDRLGRGYISRVQFHRALSSLRIMITDEELVVIAKQYENDKGIDFYKFVEDVDPTHTQRRRSFEPIGTTRQSIEDVWGHTPTGDQFVPNDIADKMIRKSKKGLDVRINEQKTFDGLIMEIQRWAYINSVVFHEFLEDFDVHKINEIPKSQFRSGMSMSTIKLTEAELKILFTHYASHTRPGFVRWREFADDVLHIIAPHGLEKDPQTTPPSPQDTLNPRARSLDEDLIMPQNVKSIIEVVARFVKTRRISLMEMFKDKDRLNHRRVNQTGFAQVLQLIGVHITKGEIDILGVYYNDPKTNFVDYVKFVNDVNDLVGLIFGDRASDHIIQNPIPPYGQSDSPYLIQSRSLSDHEDDDKEIIEKIQTYVYKRRIRLYEFFEGFDQLRHGKVSKQKFRTVIGQANIPLREDQIETLLDKYTVEEESDMFNYRKFCRKVNKVFGEIELEKKPVDVKTRSGRPYLPEPSETINRLSQYEEQQLRDILDRFAKIVSYRRMNIRDQFVDYDRRPHKNFITRQQFKQSIARLGLTTNQKELDIICKKYRCTDLDDMNYNAFCNDIEQPEYRKPMTTRYWNQH